MRRVILFPCLSRAHFARPTLQRSCPSRSFVFEEIPKRKMSSSKTRSEAEWQATLTPQQFSILRQKNTEAPGTGVYNKHTETGVYLCAGCETPLYTSDHKFDSGCGWPAYFDCIPGAVKSLPDADGRRVEIVCAACGGHLGHVFKGEGFKNPTDERHCVNSVSLKFNKEDAPKE